MKVFKIGGGCLKGKETIAHILDLIAQRCCGEVIVVSALNGVTDFLIESMSSALEDEGNIPDIIGHIKGVHMTVARHLISERETLKKFSLNLNGFLGQLERLYYGLSFTKEITPRMRDAISSFGERLCVKLLTSILQFQGIKAIYLMPNKIGLLTDGKYGDASANMRKTGQNLQRHVKPLLNGDTILFIPGFFGVSEGGDITTFGRGGSDYSAAVVAVALQAEMLEIWKDVSGFMSADPKVVSEAQHIPVLSYEEAAELSYFGAKILHPRMVEPLRRKKLDIAIKNTVDPDAEGSLITARSPRPKMGVRSVAHDTNIGILKVHASGVGARLGVLARVSNQLTENGINIKSVVTSQTCISILLEHKDLETGYNALNSLKPRPYQRIEKLKDVALVSIVGAGLVHRKGIAARCFTAVASRNINVEMISFGPSRAALYFIVKNRDLNNALNAIHRTFFSKELPG